MLNGLTPVYSLASPPRVTAARFVVGWAVSDRLPDPTLIGEGDDHPSIPHCVPDPIVHILSDARAGSELMNDAERVPNGPSSVIDPGNLRVPGTIEPSKAGA